ncbi:MAG: acetate--CoA ligase family protein [Patescibacteria group bacterium]|nr:acetate--CoA ligase family protein [Patescibacteria group bacterium]
MKGFNMDLNPIFYPKSIAIIGASSREKTVGNDVVKNLAQQGFEGKIYPINPKIDELYGLKVYHSIEEVDAEIDFAVVAIPAKIVPHNLAIAAKKGVKAAAVISAGFKEAGNVQLEEELKKVCKENSIALVGPNCLGAINPEIKMNASFGQLMPKLGNVAFMSQSGALCAAVLDYAQDLGVGFSKFISIGNKADIDELKLIKYLAKDEQTKVILIYAEELQNAPAFIKTIKEINQSSNPKPVIVLKSGRTEAGAGAIVSHTGSLAGGDAAYNALFEQAGMLRAESIKEVFDLAQVFARNELSGVKNTAIITNAGGPGVLTTDEVVDNGLELAKLSEDTVKKLEEYLPAAANAHNPVDILGDARADRYEHALQVVSQDDQVDSILLIMTPQSMTEVDETAKAVIKVKEQSDKPIVVSFMGSPTVASGVKLMNEADVATIAFPEPAAKGLAQFGRYAAWTEQKNEKVLTYFDVDKDKVTQILAEAKKQGKTSFPEAEAMAIVKAYNFPLLQSEVATSAEEAKQIAEKVGKKLAMKIVSPDILHKSDVGGVMLNVTTKTVIDQYKEMMTRVKKNKSEADLKGVLLMEMAPQGGTEVILGVNKALGLGTMVMFGLGGIYVEVLKDVNFAYPPLTKSDALRMINTLKTAELFEGVRGEKPRDKAALVECIGRLAQLVSDFPEIKELDINPLLALPEGEGAKLLDVRVVLENWDK